MELDEFKKAWKQFNDRINEQPLIDRQQAEEILSQKRTSIYTRLLRYEQISITIISIILILLIITIIIRMSPQYKAYMEEAFLIPTLIAWVMNLLQYRKLKQTECEKHNLECQILYVLQYQSLLYWGYIACYAAFIPAIIFFIAYADIRMATIIVVCIIIATTLDLFIFKHLLRKLSALSDINKELKELKEINDESFN